MLYKFQVHSSNTLGVGHNRKFSQRKKCIDKYGRYYQAYYVIMPKMGCSLWELGSTIVLKFGATVINGLCYIEARKLVAEKIKTATRGRWLMWALQKGVVRWKLMRGTLCENSVLIWAIVFVQSLRQKSRWKIKKNFQIPAPPDLQTPLEMQFVFISLTLMFSMINGIAKKCDISDIQLDFVDPCRPLQLVTSVLDCFLFTEFGMESLSLVIICLQCWETNYGPT